MTGKLETTKKSYTKPFYINQDMVNDLTQMGSQGAMINGMLEFHDIKEAIKCLNVISFKHEMFPSLAFSALSYCEISQIKCVIIGGMPDPTMLDKWTGSGYSYSDIKDHRTLLHKKMIEDIHGPCMFVKEIQTENYALQSDGVLLLHEAMSVTQEEPLTCRGLWAPIIFRILNLISIADNNVPIIFTTVAARQSFSSAVLASNYTACCHFAGETMIIKTPDVFENMEDTINRGRMVEDKIDFIKLITQ
jgi:uracil DNA glycosylase